MGCPLCAVFAWVWHHGDVVRNTFHYPPPLRFPGGRRGEVSSARKKRKNFAQRKHSILNVEGDELAAMWENEARVCTFRTVLA